VGSDRIILFALLTLVFAGEAKQRGHRRHARAEESVLNLVRR